MAGKVSLYYLSGFNNYYSRQVKKPQSNLVSDYDDYIYDSRAQQNFNPGDNVNTSIVVNIDDNVEIDYILVSTPEDSSTIGSRWFVLDRNRALGGQWTMNLRRDLFADYYSEIIHSPAFIEKGYIKDTENPLIYNNENLILNQIKVGEHLIKDEVSTPWVVGYIAKNVFGSDTGFSTGINIEARVPVNTGEYPQVSLSDVQFYYDRYGTEGFNGPSLSGKGFPRIRASYEYRIPDTTVVFSNLKTDSAGEVDDQTSYNVKYYGSVYDIENVAADVKAQYTQERQETFSELALDLGKDVSQDTIDELVRYSGQTVKDTDSGQLFTYTISSIGYGMSETTIARGTTLYDEYVELVNDVYEAAGGTGDMIEYVNDTTRKSGFFWLNSHNVYSVSKPQLVSNDTKISGQISPLINFPNDAPYYIFAMPYDSINIAHEYESGEVWSVTKTFYTKLILEKVMSTLGPGQFLYDVQLLPFTPSPLLQYKNPYSDYFEFDFKGAGVATAKDVTKFYYTDEIGNNRIATVMFWLPSSSFRNNISFNEIQLPTTSVDLKIENETKMYRLVSPNYAGAFEFSVAKNGGLSGFEVNCTMKPYQPYIHINPIFGGLYGGDYNDSRGLICGGDFTVPQTTDAWRNFQIQNKSYLESFNRQIESMEVNNAIQREREIWGLVAGSITGTASAGGTGAMIGSTIAPGVGTAVGAVAGATVGAAAGIIGGIKDLELADRQRQEALDYTKDQFGYQLRNIRALPNTLSRTSAFDVNNKLFPFLEVYDCTDTEKEALRNKIKYNGMTVMAISSIEKYTDFNGRYVKGQLIRLEDENEQPVGEYHEVLEIAAELQKGVYI